MDKDIDGTNSLQVPPRPGHLLQVPGASSSGRGQRMEGVSTQPTARQIEVVVADWDIQQVQSVCPDLGPDLLGGGSVGHTLRVGDMGTDTTHEEGSGRIPPQGGPKADGDETTEVTGQIMGLTPAGVETRWW